MTNANKPARATVGKLRLNDLLTLAVEAGITIGGCLALHAWMVG